MINFGVGQLVLIPSGATPTPLQLGTLQDVQIDTEYTEKELYGAFQFPVDVARAQAKLTAKAHFATINGALFNQVYTGATSAAGYTAGAINESHTVASTVTVTNSATFVADNGVINRTTGAVMTRVASAPATGEYSVAAGVYTFASADVGNTVWISYSYTVASTGFTTTLTNQLMGSGTTYVAYLFNSFRSKAIGCKLFAVTLPKLSLPSKNMDYTIAELDLSCYADASGNVIEEYTAD